VRTRNVAIAVVAAGALFVFCLTAYGYRSRLAARPLPATDAGESRFFVQNDGILPLFNVKAGCRSNKLTGRRFELSPGGRQFIDPIVNNGTPDSVEPQFEVRLTVVLPRAHFVISCAEDAQFVTPPPNPEGRLRFRVNHRGEDIDPAETVHELRSAALTLHIHYEVVPEFPERLTEFRFERNDPFADGSNWLPKD